MEDIAKRECGEHFISMVDTRDPLLIILRQIRNYEIHLGTNSYAKTKRDLLWGDPKKIEDAILVNVSIVYIDNLTIDKLTSLHFAKRSQYHKDALSISLIWFNLLQQDWGIDELIYRGIISYLHQLKIINFDSLNITR